MQTKPRDVNDFLCYIRHILLCGNVYNEQHFLNAIIWFHPLPWRHNDHDSVSNHQPCGCLLNYLFGRRSKKTSKLRVTGLYAGNSPGPVNSPQKGPVTRKMFPFDDVIMQYTFLLVTILFPVWDAATLQMRQLWVIFVIANVLIYIAFLLNIVIYILIDNKSSLI